MNCTNAAVPPILAVLLLGCIESPEPAPSTQPEPQSLVTLSCAPEESIARVSGLNYPDRSCDDARSTAEGQLSSLHYRRACQAVSPTDALPAAVSSAKVTECLDTDGRGAFVDIEVCCPVAVEIPPPSVTVERFRGPICPQFQTTARATDLHYPDADSCASIRSIAATSLDSAHYRKACAAAVPRSSRKAAALEARVVECRSGGVDPGVYVHVEVCCAAKVFEEAEFRELVWQRSRADVRQALGAPESISAQASGSHWKYPFEIARADKVFPEVTLVFVDGVVNSYSFEL